MERFAIDMSITIAKFLHLGMPLWDVILKTTLQPARAIEREHAFGILQPGTADDIFMPELEESKFYFENTHPKTEKAGRRIWPRLLVKSPRDQRPWQLSVRRRELCDCDRNLHRSVERTTSVMI